MLAEERYTAILNLVNQKQAITVPELTAALGASEATIRRDLNALHRQGRLHKVHGGATAIKQSFIADEPDIPTKSSLHVEEKEAIARYAAAQIQDDDVVFLDAGTTTLRMLNYLPACKATFVTNGITLASRMVAMGLKAFIVGGQLKPGTEAVIGGQAAATLSAYNFTKAFLGTNGVSIKQGYTTPDPEEALVKGKAMEQAYMSYVLADASKFGIITAMTFAPLHKACIITNVLPDKSYTQHAIVKEVGNA
mgnify:CR=1 FL=1